MRALATIRKIAEIKPIPEADLIEAYRVDGWWVVDSKGKYQINDLVVYCEVDSWIPNTVAPFLSKGKDPKVFEGVLGERLRTVRLKKQLSQGMLLPIEPTCKHIDSQLFEGLDVTCPVGILKWEAPIPAQLSGMALGNFPSGVPKTEQERIQNVDYGEFSFEKYEVTEKLLGTSCTFFLDENEQFHVCSRNLDLKFDENNTYWKMAIKHAIETKMKAFGLKNHAIQGEICGEGINGNNYKKSLEFYVFDLFSTATGYLNPFQRYQLVKDMGLPHVPILFGDYFFMDTKGELLLKAEGKSVIADCQREGFVFKALTSSKRFKVVSNAWLLKYD